MKSVHIIIPSDKKHVVETVLEKLGFDYIPLLTGEYILIIINLPDEKVEGLIDSLKSIGVGQFYGTYIIYEASYSAISETEAMEPTEVTTRRVSRDEILLRIRNNSVLSRNYIIFTVAAAIISTLGLLTDNVVMIVASMIIAPLMAPILGTSIGIVLNLPDIRNESLKSEFIGLIIGIIVGFIITLLLPYSTITREMLLRAYPSMLDVLFALSAGVAAALSTVSAEVMTLVGVAIAASLLPPATNIGIGFAYLVKGVPLAQELIIGSSILLAINILSITLASISFFWFVGIRPGESIRKTVLAKKKFKKKLLLVVALFIIVTVPLVYTSIQHYKSEKIELMVKKRVIKFIDEHAPEVKLLSIDVHYIAHEDKVEIFLAIGVEKITDTVESLPQAIANDIQENFDIKADVYVQIYLAYIGK